MNKFIFIIGIFIPYLLLAQNISAQEPQWIASSDYEAMKEFDPNCSLGWMGFDRRKKWIEFESKSTSDTLPVLTSIPNQNFRDPNGGWQKSAPESVKKAEEFCAQPHILCANEILTAGEVEKKSGFLGLGKPARVYYLGFFYYELKPASNKTSLICGRISSCELISRGKPTDQKGPVFNKTEIEKLRSIAGCASRSKPGSDSSTPSDTGSEIPPI